jgi:hypothetical protein
MALLACARPVSSNTANRPASARGQSANSLTAGKITGNLQVSGDFGASVTLIRAAIPACYGRIPDPAGTGNPVRRTGNSPVETRNYRYLRNRGKTRGNPYSVIAGLVLAISIIGALCPPDRHRRDKPGDDETARREFCPSYHLRFSSPIAACRIGSVASAGRQERK